MGTAADDPPKKKRRQNVACDPCKLRRIKCDLLTLLSAGPTASTSTDEEPAHILVRRNSGVTCTNCRNKGLQCATEGILNPLKPSKGGKRIDEARKRFGTDGELGSTPNNGSARMSGTGVTPGSNTVMDGNTGIDWTDGDDGQALLDQLGMGAFANDNTGLSTTHAVNHGLESIASLSQIDWTFGSPQQPTSNSLLRHPFPAVGSSSQSFTPILTNIDSLDASFDKSLHGNLYHPPAPSHLSGPETQRQAVKKWEQLSVNTPQTIATRALRPPTPSPFAQVSDERLGMGAHTPQDHTILPALGRLDLETNTYLPVDQQAAAGVRIVAAYNGQDHQTGTIARNNGHIDQSVSSSLKRQRISDSVESTPASSISTELLNPWERDPWHIWQLPSEDGGRMVAWSRREQVQESLADKALGIELSRHLITVYFQAVHFSLPVLSPESFYIEWEACGRRADLMSPASEALCAVIEAWASRYSDNPAILGLPYQRAHTAPKVITEDGQFTPGTQARVHWGKSRLPVCNALSDRAGRIIDANSLMRRPSVTGLQAMALYNQLMHMSDQGSRVKDQWVQNMIMHSTIIEQMRILQMFWTDGEPIITDDESMKDTLQFRMKQRRLFWTTAVADSCWAAATGLPPKMPEEELDAGRAWVDEVIDNLPDSTMKILAFFMKIWHRLAMVGREVSLKVTKFNNKKGNIAVESFCAAIQRCWGEIRSISTELNESALKLLGACEPGVFGFSPLNYMTNMRLCCPFFLLVLHEAIRNQLAFRESFYQSYVVDPETEVSPSSQRNADLTLLGRLQVQSVDILLYNSRSHMRMFKDLLPTGMIQSASIMIRVLIASGQFLAEVPTNEQGYPSSTLGGFDWTWEKKQEAVSICIEALYQIGWAWSDVSEVLEQIHLSMERMTPRPSVFETYHNTPKPINVKIQMQRSREMKIEEDGLQSALRFWPPQSIPGIIEASKSPHPGLAPHIPRGIPGSDLGHSLPIPSNSRNDAQNQILSQGGWSSSSFTPGAGLGVGDMSSQTSMTPSALSHSQVDGEDQNRLFTNDIPGFTYLAHDPSSSIPDRGMTGEKKMPTNQDPRDGSNRLTEDELCTGHEDIGTNDQAFWDIITGGQEEELDFTAFLKDFAEAQAEGEATV